MSSLKHRDVLPAGTTLTVSASAMARLRAHAVEGYPHEVVGILAGERANKIVQHAEALHNEDARTPEKRFAVNGRVLMKAEQRLVARGLEVVGYYHTHPDHPAMYSDTDRDLALPNMSYVIAAVHDGQVVDVKSWRLRDDRSEMDLEEIVEDNEPTMLYTSLL